MPCFFTQLIDDAMDFLIDLPVVLPGPGVAMAYGPATHGLADGHGSMKTGTAEEKDPL